VTAYFCERALLDNGWEDDVLIEVEDGVIETVGIALTAEKDATVLSGLVIPGMANAHSHAFHRALRARTHALGGSFWTWRDLMYEAAHKLTPDSYYELATAVFAEMLEAGFTAVGEFHYLHHQADGTPYSEPNTMAQRVVDAANDVGIRITLLDTLYLHGGLDADGYRPLTANQLRFSDRSVDRYLDRTSGLNLGGLSKVGTAIHSIRAVDPESIAVVGSVLDRPIHAHLSEQPDENTQSLAAHGGTPTQLFSDAGVLSPSFTAVHATHLTPHDISLAGGAGASVCFCPTTERDLADGVGPAAELEKAGARLCVGSDSHAVIDPFEEMRAIEMHERLATHRRGVLDSADLITAANVNGYEAIGWPGGGQIAVGAPADLVCVGFGSNRLAGADRSLPDDALVFAAGAQDVTDVVVAGRHVVTAGSHRTVSTAEKLDGVIKALFQ
jgi:formiminoglutamate deiminase